MPDDANRLSTLDVLARFAATWDATADATSADLIAKIDTLVDDIAHTHAPLTGDKAAGMIVGASIASSFASDAARRDPTYAALVEESLPVKFAQVAGTVIAGRMAWRILNGTLDIEDDA